MAHNETAGDAKTEPGDAGGPGPIFVGGTGRSGTTVVGRLIGQHDRFALIPYEVRFHAEPQGIPGLLKGNVTVEQFQSRMRDEWFHSTPQGRAGGLSRMADEERVEAALATFAAAFDDDPPRACRELMNELLDPLVREVGKPSWVEMTPRNAMHAEHLLEIYPEMKLVLSVRDGRDTAGSLVAKRWAPDMEAGLAWWGARMRQVKRSTRRIPKSHLLVIRLERLVASTHRDDTYKRLLDFLEVEDQPQMREYFDREVTPKRAHIGRWKEQLGADEVDDFLELHRQIQAGHKKQKRTRSTAAEPAKSGEGRGRS